MSLCSVIIVADNRRELLFATIESVLMQKQLDELLVVDSCNAPDVASRLQQFALSEPRIKIVSGRADVNFARACNLAAKKVMSEYVLFLKVGYLLPPDALSELMGVFKTEKKTMLSSAIIQRYDGIQRTIFRAHIITPKSLFLDMVGFSSRKQKTNVKAYSRARKITNKNPSAPLDKKSISQKLQFVRKKPFEVATISSACMCIKSNDFMKFGGFDVDFFPQDEELDLSLRVQQVSGRVFCVPSVKVTQMPNVNDKRISVAQQSREAKNMIRYLNKFFYSHQPIGTLFLLNMLIKLRLMFRIIGKSLIGFFLDMRPNINNIEAKRFMVLALGTVDLPKNKQLAKKIVLVTGAASQIGLCVVRRLIASGAAVIAINKGNEIPYFHSNLHWMSGDLTDQAMHLDGYCVDAVVHCAPLWQLPSLVGMLKNAEAKRIIAFSSTSVFFKSLSADDSEKKYILKLKNAENLLAEKCDAAGIAYSIFRPTQVYGVGLDKGITKIAKFIRRFRVMFVYSTAFGRRQPVHVDDLAVAVVQAIENETTYGKSYNLSGADVFTYREMLERMFEICNKKPRIVSSTMLPFILDVSGKLFRKSKLNGEVARRMNDDLVFFHDDATRDFDFSPRKFLNGGIRDVEGF